MAESIVALSQKLAEIYDDKDGSRTDEIASLGGEVYDDDKDRSRTDEIASLGEDSASRQNDYLLALREKYLQRVREIEAYHRRHPTVMVVDEGEDADEILEEVPWIEFSGEEAYGRYLDLHELYNAYVNSKFGRKVNGESFGYSDYLEEFSRPQNVPRRYKLSRPYQQYLESLIEYLRSFLHRTQPLQDLDKVFSNVETEFNQLWDAGAFHGWEDLKELDKPADPMIDIDDYDSLEELMELGPERLKDALSSLGLKAGGTLQERAGRLLLAKTTPLAELNRKHFAVRRYTEADAVQQWKEVALAETQLQRLCELLDEVIEETKAHVDRRQALTYEEMEAEREEEEEVQAQSESGEEDQAIHNPLKLPMGWDGNPIPYWLYKLHGLGQECEICGNNSYWGRRAFERH